MEELNTTIEGQESESQLVENVVETVESENVKEPIRDNIEDLTREEIVSYFKRIMDTHPLAEVSQHLQDLHDKYEQMTSQLNNDLRVKFVEQGGDPLDFAGIDDFAHTTMTTLYDEFKQKRDIEKLVQDKIRHDNYKEKLSLIDEIKQLLKDGDISSNYNAIKSLIDKWDKIGPVPGNVSRDLGATFKNCKDEFYQNVRIARELKENAFKHNYEEKVKLCEQAEALMESSSASSAFFVLQQLHTQWKSIGPVPRAESDALWERFRVVTSKVNERYHRQQDKIRDKEKENYEKKLALCEEVEALSKVTFKSAKDCDKVVNQVLEIQQKWRTIGFAPKEHNDDIYARFRASCDAIFEHKRTFYKEYNGMLSVNLTKKIALCERAESMADSTDWKVTTDTLIGLQKRWKEIGPVAHKHSDEVWVRFRTACDKFFENKNKHFNGLDEQYEGNLEKKMALIEELKACQLPEDSDEQIKLLQSFQQRWNEIGYVPMKKKNEVNQMFSQLINKHFDKLASDDMQRNMQRFKSRVELMLHEESGMEKLNHERNKLITKLRQMESDVVTLENNIGFFSKSKQSDRMINEVKEKIKVAKQNIDVINEKLDILDAVVKDD